MLGTPLIDESSIPSLVRITLARLEDDLDEALDLLRRAKDVEWVSDVADSYLLHLDRVTRLTLAVATRVSMAEIAVRPLERSA